MPASHPKVERIWSAVVDHGSAKPRQPANSTLARRLSPRRSHASRAKARRLTRPLVQAPAIAKINRTYLGDAVEARAVIKNDCPHGYQEALPRQCRRPSRRIDRVRSPHCSLSSLADQNGLRQQCQDCGGGLRRTCLSALPLGSVGYIEKS